MIVKKKRLFVIIIVGFFAISAIIAQDTVKYRPRRLFIFTSGIGSHLLREEAISPLIYQGSEAPINFTYKYFRKKSRQIWSIYYDNLELSSSLTDPYAKIKENYYDINNIYFEYSYNKRLYCFNKRNINLYLGLKLMGILSRRQHYLDNFKDFTQNVISSCGFNVLLEKNFSTKYGDFAYFNFFMPVIASIPVHYYNAKVFDFKNVNFESFKTYFEFQSELGYIVYAGKHIGFEFKHMFHLYSITSYGILNTRHANNNFLVGLVIKL